MKMSNELDNKVNKAKLLLLKKKHFAFISSMLYKLNCVEDVTTPPKRPLIKNPNAIPL